MSSERNLCREVFRKSDGARYETASESLWRDRVNQKRAHDFKCVFQDRRFPVRSRPGRYVA
jgi:hypothetical protein